MLLKEKPRKKLENYTPKINKQKSNKLNQLKEILNNSKLIIFTSYQKPKLSLKAWEFVKYNIAIEEVGGDIKVAKNSLLKIALEELGHEHLAPKIRGAIVINYTDNDPVALSKKLTEFITNLRKERNIKEDLPEILFGILDNKFITAEQVKYLANIPPKEILLGQLAWALKGTISKLASTLNAIILKLIWALEQVKEKKNS
jgi:large subunit ribosomal protein L10